MPNAREIEIAVLGNDAPEVSVPGEVIPSREFYDYEAKYLDEGSKVIIPADLGPRTVADIQRLSIAAFKAIDCAGMARVDFLLSPDTIFINEVNTLPGMTATSLLPEIAKGAGISFPDLVEEILRLTVTD